MSEGGRERRRRPTSTTSTGTLTSLPLVPRSPFTEAERGAGGVGGRGHPSTLVGGRGKGRGCGENRFHSDYRLMTRMKPVASGPVSAARSGRTFRRLYGLYYSYDRIVFLIKALR